MTAWSWRSTTSPEIIINILTKYSFPQTQFPQDFRRISTGVPEDSQRICLSHQLGISIRFPSGFPKAAEGFQRERNIHMAPGPTHMRMEPLCPQTSPKFIKQLREWSHNLAPGSKVLVPSLACNSSARPQTTVSWALWELSGGWGGPWGDLGWGGALTIMTS